MKDHLILGAVIQKIRIVIMMLTLTGLFISCSNSSKPDQTGTRPDESVASNTPPASALILPILCYHAIKKNPKSMWEIGINDFDMQMNYLFQNQYKTVSLQDVKKWLYQGNPLPPKAILLTFDDWDESHYEIAFPILKKYNFVATFNVVSKRIGDPTSIERLTEVIAYGCSVASHSVSHFSLVMMNAKKMQQELTKSKADIERLTNTSVDFFCYPFGNFNKAVIDALKKAGYAGALTTVPGKNYENTAPFELRRILVENDWPLEHVKRYLNFDRNTYIATYESKASEYLNRGLNRMAEVVIGELVEIDKDRPLTKNLLKRLEGVRN